ncbi:hypothetical protein pEaSNUABM44_00368 [Erwinia phage pEa_SNUABM_44]|nr:hypothetical protein pEaSNUABM44_00368 [Erwinia phage pEa_SNUABM_44]
MLSPIFEIMLNPEHSHSRFERYDGVRNKLIISTSTHELEVTLDYIKLDLVHYNMNVINPFHGIPIHRELVVMIDYEIFLMSNSAEVFGITRDDIVEVLSYYRKFS